MRPSLLLLCLLLALGCSAGESRQDEAAGEEVPDVETPDIHSTSDAAGDTPEGDSGEEFPTNDISPSTDVDSTRDEENGEADAEETGETPRGAEHCPDAPEGVSPGYAIGDQLDALNFNTCDATPYALNSTCGAAATWIFMAHAWCGDCQQVASFSDEVAAYFEEHNVAIVHVLVHSPLETLPVAVDCVDWQTAWGFEATTLVYDPWFASVLLADTGQTAQSVLLDANRVIVDKLHTADEAEIIAAIQTILSP